jgi:dihydrofolate reductase
MDSPYAESFRHPAPMKEAAPMGTVIFDTSMSLDGFMTAANRTPEEPTGAGGQVLTEWAMDSDERNRRYLADAVEGLGAVIAGRITYDTSLPWWGPDGPSGNARRPVFVVTHQAPETNPEGGVYNFVTDGIESALEQAKTAAGDKVVVVMGGASLGQQYIAAGLVDEIQIHLVPVIFGSGTRMFENLGDAHLSLEPTEVLETPLATHIRYRIV